MPELFQAHADWLQERTGRITASDVHKIMGRGRAKDKYFSDQGETYLRCKIGELLTGEIENGGRANTLSMEWGASHEHEAIARFEKETGRAVQEYFGVTNPKFFALDLFSGGSPDALTDTHVIEIKCPFNRGEHVRHLEDVYDTESLKQIAPEYYWQIQMNLLACERNAAYFISYDPRVIYHKLQFLCIEIDRVHEDIALLEERLMEAKKYMNSRIEVLRENFQTEQA
jgi:hypothetical protein